MKLVFILSALMGMITCEDQSYILTEEVLDEIYEVRYYEQLFQLSSKNFTSIKPMTFWGLNDLRTLNLSNNLLNDLSLNTFYGLTSLEILDLSFNKIQSLDTKIFTGLISLEVLNLKGNMLKYASTRPWFSNPSLRKLTDLDLSMNQIQLIDQKMFTHLENLLMIDLRQNNIIKLENEPFSDLFKLQDVYLQNNNIKIVKLEAINSICIQHLELNENPINEYLVVFNVSRNSTGHFHDKYSHTECVRIAFTDTYTSDLPELKIELSEYDEENDSNIMTDSTKLMLGLCFLVVLVFSQFNLIVCFCKNSLR